MIDIENVVLVFVAGLFESELLGSDLQLKRRVRQDDQRLAAFHECAVLDQHLLHGAALVGRQIVRDERRHGAAHGDEIVERTFADRADGQPVDGYAIDMRAGAGQKPRRDTGHDNNPRREGSIAAPKGFARNDPVHAARLHIVSLFAPKKGLDPPHAACSCLLAHTHDPCLAIAVPANSSRKSNELAGQR